MAQSLVLFLPWSSDSEVTSLWSAQAAGQRKQRDSTGYSQDRQTHTSVGVRITACNPNSIWFSDWFYLTLLFQINTLYSVWWGTNIIMHCNYVWVWKVFGGRYLLQGDLAQSIGVTKTYTDLIQDSLQLSQIPFEHKSRKSTPTFWVSHLQC